MKIESLFGLVEEQPAVETLTELPMNWIYPYPNQPFELYNDYRIQELADDIEKRGLDNPIIVRKLEEEHYQIIAGHNRFNAVKRLGWNRIPANIKELTDEEAMIYLVQSNLLQRTEILESEKVKAYALRAKALKRQGQKGTSIYNSLEQLSKSESIKPRTLSRYIACANLIPDLLELLDKKRISLNIGEQLAKLTVEHQQELADYLNNHNVKLTMEQVKAMVEHEQNELFEIDMFMTEPSKKEMSEEQKDKKVDALYQKLVESIEYQIYLENYPNMEKQNKELLKVLLELEIAK